MAIQRITTAAILMTLGLFTASLFLQSPHQLWLLMAGVGLITGVSFKLGQRHVITGFGLGIAITLLRESLIYGHLIKVTAPVYAAGYLFAVATTLLVSYLILHRFFLGQTR